MLGLNDKEVVESKKKHGSNEITKRHKNSFIGLLIESLGDPIIRILLIALGIKVVFLIKDFDWYETVGIVIAIFLASFISSVSEYGSEKAFDKLQLEASKIKCRVKRNNKISEISIDDVVVNDIVILEAGDKVPADGIIVEGNVSVDESSLNGESKEVYKDLNEIIYRGTVIYSNRALMKVTKVGSETFFGKLAEEIQEKKVDSPLKIRLRKLAEFISKVGYLGAFLVSLSYLFSVVFINNSFRFDLIMETITNGPLMIGHILYALTLSVTIIVVAVPEGLPMMINLVLSSNMKKMLKQNILVRKLVGIETAGSLNILFTDKTGTLTKGKLEVAEFVNSNLDSFKSIDELKKLKLYEIAKLSMIGNNASSLENGIAIGGNITDQAILNFIKESIYVNKVKEVPFNSKNKYAITTTNEINLIKGAPEKILPFCTSYYDNDGQIKTLFSKKRISNFIEQKTKEGIRVLVMGTYTNHQIITLVGMVLIKDDLREDALEAVEMVKEAHIQIVMITGDNKNTAYSIGREVGIVTSVNDVVLTSDELDMMTDEEISVILPNLRIVARSLPSDKSRLVRICQSMDLVVGMTGDGVNDAPAIKKADVGFSMGSGTEVAKEASDIVILDNNFMSIAHSILFGRTIFKSIRKFIIFQLTVNLCAVSLSIIGPFIGIDTPVTVIQMLWINMVMDTLAGLAFSFEPPLKEYMSEYPKAKNESIVNQYMMEEILFTGIYSFLLCIFFLKIPFLHSFVRNEEIYLMTTFFGLFIFVSIFNSFNARTHRLNIFANLQKNKVFILVISFIVIVQLNLIYYGGSLFRTAGLSIKELLMTIILAGTVIPIDFIRKILLRKKGEYGGV
ncbi:MAG: calcium-translocating P-type ATPase, PMCA-type [Bacilli bacterium]|nr:calcium-translocating P-type ATPase, PMCA-type [Bacilli bacterium]MDD4808682.1 calcium-translocating P-type ATPase, PMCA-type [Bacilli bacterium]